MKRLLFILICCTATTTIQAQGPGFTRWYSFFQTVDMFFVNNVLTNNVYYLPIWQDSTVLQKVDTGYAPVKYASYYQIIDPLQSKIFNDSRFANQGQITIGNKYIVDSVSIFGTYIRMPNQDSNQVDTLIISVIPVAPNKTFKQHLSKTQQPNISWYTTKDTAWAYRPQLVDSTNLAAYGDTITTLKNRILIKRLLTAADGDTASTTTYKQFIVAVDPVLQLDRGEFFGITVSFKSGGTWTKNVTRIDSLHRFMPVVSYYKADSAMPYYYEKYTEHSSAGFMLTSNLAEYVPTLFLEANSTPSFREEFVWVDANTVCADCVGCFVPTSQHNDNPAFISIYPNPASHTVYFELKDKTNKTHQLTITNNLGVVVAQIPLRDKTYWDVNEQPRGLYYYTLTNDMGKVSSGTLSVF